MFLWVQTIQSDVLVTDFQSPCRAVEAVDFSCTRHQCTDAKPPCIAKYIQDFFVFGVGCEQCAVFPLVQKETGLLAMFPIDEVLAAIFRGSMAMRCFPQAQPSSDWSPPFFAMALELLS